MRRIVQLFLALLVLMAAVPSIRSAESPESWLHEGHYADYAVAVPPGEDSFGVLIDVDLDGNLTRVYDSFCYGWRALSVADGLAEIQVHLEATARRFKVNMSALVVVDLTTLQVFDKEGTSLGLWGFWIDASRYPLSGNVEVPFVEKWLARNMTAKVSFCSPTAGFPPVQTGVGVFQDYFCKTVPPTTIPILSRYGLDPPLFVITNRHDVNVGLMLDTAAGTLVDDVLYSVFGVLMFDGWPVTLNVTNVDLTQPVVTTSPPPVPVHGTGFGLYAVVVASAVCIAGSLLIQKRRRDTR